MPQKTEIPITKAPQSTEKKVAQAKDRTITVKNNIEKKMTGYKYIFKTYYPSEFKISFNGKELEQGTEAKITLKNNKLFARYIYNFPPYKKGTKEIEFDIEPTAQEVDITFSWKDDWRVIASHATPVETKEITA